MIWSLNPFKFVATFGLTSKVGTRKARDTEGDLLSTTSNRGESGLGGLGKC
jgi:hypothetical protein